MPNSLDSNGLVIKTLAEVITDLENGFKTIYGADINVDSNSPDGQVINLFAQTIVDNLEVLEDVYNALDPELATGVNLGKSFAMNGLARNPASYTTTPVSITANQALTLVGIDALIANPTAQVYAVQDDNKNVFQLVTTYVFSGAATASLTFQAQEPGSIAVLPNTITEQNTPQLGVTAVANASTAGTVVGADEETDVAFKIRRSKMFLLASTGPADAVQAALLAPYYTAGFGWSQAEDALVVENDTSGAVNGVAAYSIYCVVKNDGTAGHPVGIANQIMSKKSPGCGQTGGESQVIARANGQSFTAKWDWAVAQDLFISFGITPRVTGETFNSTLIKAALADYLEYFLGQTASIGDIIVAMSVLYPTAIITACGVSDEDASYGDTVSPTLLKNYFTVDPANITIA